MRLPAAAAVLSLAAYGLIGCASTSTHASPAAATAQQKATTNPCSLLSASDISTALQTTVTSTIPLARASCTYMLPSTQAQPGEVDVLVDSGTRGADDWQTDEQDPVQSIGGVGDEAWTITNSQYHKIGVRQGDLYVFVTVVQDDPNLPSSDTLVALARDVLGHVT
jgi:hypothetical protein